MLGGLPAANADAYAAAAYAYGYATAPDAAAYADELRSIIPFEEMVRAR